jgi:cyclophilin family peptidyl-prolyl cis-trans isomerase
MPSPNRYDVPFPHTHKTEKPMKNRMKQLLTILLISCLGSASAWAGNVYVEMKTSLGTITLELDADKAPQTVANFVQYAKDGFYDGTIFHRVIKDFMIQGGGYTADMQKKETREPIQNEAKNGLKNKRGTIAMARTSAPHSATAQFFINHKDNDFLDYPSRDGWGYCVFGKVTAGMDVVDAIASQPTGIAHGMRDVPRETILIEQVTVSE